MCCSQESKMFHLNQKNFFLSEVDNRDNNTAIKAHSDTCCPQKRIGKSPLFLHQSYWEHDSGRFGSEEVHLEPGKNFLEHASTTVPVT